MLCKWNQTLRKSNLCIYINRSILNIGMPKIRNVYSFFATMKISPVMGALWLSIGVMNFDVTLKIDFISK